MEFIEIDHYSPGSQILETSQSTIMMCHLTMFEISADLWRPLPLPLCAQQRLLV